MVFPHPFNLRELRASLGWTQKDLAARLAVSQTLVSLMESGKRPVSHEVWSELTHFSGVPASALPLRDDAPLQSSDFMEELANLGYPGFAHRRTGRPGWNPAQLLVMALSLDTLERPVAEALPWILLRYPDADWMWVLRESKLRDLSNRFGFILTLARELTDENNPDAAAALRTLEALVERSRLARQDTFCNETMTLAERDWLQSHSSEQARRWNVLSDLKPEYLTHAR